MFNDKNNAIKTHMRTTTKPFIVLIENLKLIQLESFKNTRDQKG